MSELEDSLILAASENCFLDALYKEYLKDQEVNKELGAVLARMHNDGTIDLIAEYTKLNRSDQGRDFFMLRHILDDALPILEAKTKDVISCVKHLIKEAGNDMSASWIVGPFTEFCKAKTTRPDEAIDLELKDFDKNIELLSSAILAGTFLNLPKYLNIAIDLMNNEVLEVIQCTIFAIGRIDFKGNKKLLSKSFNAIMQTSRKLDYDGILSTSLRSLFNLFLQEKALSGELISFINAHSKPQFVQFIHVATDILFRDKSRINEDTEAPLLDAARLVNVESKGSIELLDYYLAYCIKNKRIDVVIKALEFIFDNTDYEITIKYFNNVKSELMSDGREHISGIITRWMLYKKVAYGRACHDLLGSSNENGIELSFDISQICDEYFDHHLFLARKACGWLFTYPLTAISLIISLIESCPDEQIHEISEIVFNPLLISYSGIVKDYLIITKESAAEISVGFCATLLDRLDKYHEGLESAFNIREFRPSEEQRFTFNKSHQWKMNEVMKEARKGSFFSNLFQESVLLYGNRSIHYIHHGEKSTRQEVPLQMISHSVELPSLVNLDPHNLENKLRWFRRDGCH